MGRRPDKSRSSAQSLVGISVCKMGWLSTLRVDKDGWIACFTKLIRVAKPHPGVLPLREAHKVIGSLGQSGNLVVLKRRVASRFEPHHTHRKSKLCNSLQRDSNHDHHG